MANKDKAQQPPQNSEKINRSVDLGDLKSELGKRSATRQSALESVDFGDLKGELGKGKPK